MNATKLNVGDVTWFQQAEYIASVNCIAINKH
uniref:Uncharacterized protein n=1 Tax=Anguilla anguilla TaxID=7936 RepID=A0A0E9PDB7_ANGAN